MHSKIIYYLNGKQREAPPEIALLVLTLSFVVIQISRVKKRNLCRTYVRYMQTQQEEGVCFDFFYFKGIR